MASLTFREENVLIGSRVEATIEEKWVGEKLQRWNETIYRRAEGCSDRVTFYWIKKVI